MGIEGLAWLSNEISRTTRKVVMGSERGKKKIKENESKDGTKITAPNPALEISPEDQKRYNKIVELRREKRKAIEERNWEKEKQIMEEMRKLGHKFKG